MTARLVLAVLVAAFIGGLAEPLGRLVADLLQGAALLAIVGIGLWLIVATPFRHRL